MHVGGTGGATTRARFPRVRYGALFIAVLLAACGGRAAIERRGGSAGAADAGIAGTGAGGSASSAGAGGATEFVQCPPDGSALAAYQAISNQLCAAAGETCGDGCALSCSCVSLENGLTIWSCLEPPCILPAPVACPANADPLALEALGGRLCEPVGATCGPGGCSLNCVCQAGEDPPATWVCTAPPCK
jgi:hypothetical protein